MDDRLQAYLSKRNTYLIVCPYCRASREFLAEQIPPRMSNPFTYVGRSGVAREGGGLYFMRQRSYNPAQGRFIQPDPITLVLVTDGTNARFWHWQTFPEGGGFWSETGWSEISQRPSRE